MNNLTTNPPLVLFIIFLIGYAINSLFIVYHLLKFGLDYRTKILAFVFSIGSILLITVNFQLFSEIQWLEMFKYLNI